MPIILLSLIFIRPFISSLAFPYLDFSYSCAMLIFTAYWIFSKGIAQDKIQTFKLPLLLFCLTLIISTILSTNKSISLSEILKYTTYLSVFFIVSSLQQEQRIRLIKTMAFAGLIISILAIYQYFFGFTHTLDYLGEEKISNPFALDYISRKRAFLPFVTPNVLAGYLIMIIPLVLIDKKRAWFIIPLSLALLLTKSLGALLSLFLGIIIYLTLTSSKRAPSLQPCHCEKGKARRSNLLVFFTGFLLVISLIIMARYTNQSEHTQPLFSTLMRLNYWKDTLEIIKAHPLIGTGPGNFNLAHSRYAHNSYLQIWAEMGILGIISILWLFIAVFKFYLKQSQDPKFCHPAPFSWFFTALLAFLIHDLIDFTFFLPEVAMLWWVILGLLVTEKILVR